MFSTAEIVLTMLGLFFAALNLAMILLTLMLISPIAKTPRAYSLLILGFSLVVLHFSMEVFIWLNPLLDFLAMSVLSNLSGSIGYISLFFGIYDVWKVFEG